MKRIFTLILIIILCFSLCSCGTNTAVQPQAVETTEPASDKIEFADPIVLVDDGYLRVEVTNFFQEFFEGVGASEKDKYITMKIQNKTDQNLLIILDQLSINNNGADVFRGASSLEISPNTEVVENFRIRIDKSTPLDNMADLFQLKGILSVYQNKLYGDRAKVKTAHFYVAEAFANGYNAAEEPAEPIELLPGETATTDMAEFTLTGFSCQRELYIELYNRLVRPDDGMVYAVPEFTMRNTGKENYGLEKALYFTVDYSDGYCYEMDDYTCYIIHDKGSWERNRVGTSSGQRPDLPPLMSGTYQVYVPAIDLIETDTQSPLRIHVALPASTGSQVFIYRIR